MIKIVKRGLITTLSFKWNADTIALIKSLPSRKYNSETKNWEIPTTLVRYLKTLLNEEGIKYKSYKLKNKPKPLKIPVAKVKGFHYVTKPFKHQIDGFNFGMYKESFILMDEQGLGKTKQAIDIAMGRKKANNVRGVLIICGVNGLKYNWKREIGIHSNEKGVILGERYSTRAKKYKIGGSVEKLSHLTNWNEDNFFLITNVETLRDENILAELKRQVSKGIIDMIIMDEIHKCKNPNSQQGSNLLSLTSKYNIALSGTPLMNNILDLYVPLKWIGVEKLTYYSFMNYYCVLAGIGVRAITGYKNLDILRETLVNNSIRRTKEDNLDLPPKIRTIEYVEMSAKQEKIYNEIYSDTIKNIDLIKRSNNPLEELLRLRQATAHTGLLSSSVEESVKFKRLVELLEEITESGGNAIVFSNWTKVIDKLKPLIKKYNPAYITGKVKNREEMVDKFMNTKKCRVIVGSTSAMGTGLTLTKANYVIFLDSPWNMANKEQAEDRAHRIGTSKNVTIITIVCKNTIDEKIEELIESKGNLASLLIDGKVHKQSKGEVVDFLLS